MKCTYCGHEVPESYDFCDNCGAKLDKTSVITETAAAVESTAEPSQVPPHANQVPPPLYQAPPMYQAPPPSYQAPPMYQTPPAYQNPPAYGEEMAPVISVGQWMLITILFSIPIVNIVLILIWSFSKNTNPNKRNYSRAALIWALIGIAIYIIVFIVAGVSLFDQLSYY